jgi:hypothetical protein
MLREHGRSGYFEPMARAGRTEPDSVSIWLKLSAEDAARMTQVLTRPEFAGWTRAEWCLEMIQTALGYYTRPRRPAGADGERAPAAEPAPAEPAPAEPAPAEESATATAKAVDEPEPAEPEPPVRAECPHPADARDYQSGTCAACGAILWD